MDLLLAASTAGAGDKVHHAFTSLDWLVVGGYLALTTFIGHLLRGKQSTIKDFFVAGRSLPWPAVSGSIIATEISALTFIGVPGLVFALGGDFTYLQWGIGSIIARFIVGYFFVKTYYLENIYSPYDYVGHRLGENSKRLITSLFFVGSILGQSVRVMVTAIVLTTVTGLSFNWCVFIITAFAIAWTWMGGMQTVIWTDVVQFFVFIIGGTVCLFVAVSTLDGQWSTFFASNSYRPVELIPGGGAVYNSSAAIQTGLVPTFDWGRFTLFDLRSDPALKFTLWVGIFAMPFQNLTAFGTDQLNAQRMFCCRNEKEARKAIIFSSVSILVTGLMLFVGAAMVAYFIQHPPAGAELNLFEKGDDYVLPVWVTTVLKPGLSGLILAGAFAAAISSLDSILAALTQTSLSLIYGRDRLNDPQFAQGMLLRSRLTVLLWGLILGGFTVGLAALQEDKGVIALAFNLNSYTFGAMLGIFLLALFHIPARFSWICVGTVLSVLLVMFLLDDFWLLLEFLNIIDSKEIVPRPDIAFPWFFPIMCLFVFGAGWFSARGKKRRAHSAE